LASLASRFSLCLFTAVRQWETG